jgi:hypothetical protein
VQAEAALRRMIATTLAPAGSRYTVAEAGAIYVEHLEVVMERKRTTIADYRGYLDKHVGPFFGGRPMDRIDRARVEEYLLVKKRAGLSSKTVGNHRRSCTACGPSASSASGWAATSSRWSTGRGRRASRTGGSSSSRVRSSRR